MPPRRRTRCFFSPGVNRFDSHPPSLLYPLPTVFAPPLKELGPDSPPELQPINSSPRSRFFFPSGENQSCLCVQWSESDEMSYLAVTWKGQSLRRRQGKCEAALRGRVNFWMHIPHRDPQDGENSQRCYLTSRTHSGIWGCSLSPLNSLKRCRSEEA